jgi:flagellar hook-associated protein 2
LGISFGGINTGLPPNLVEQLIEAERMPIKSMEVKKSKIESKLNLVNDLTEKLNAVRDGIGGLADAKGFNDIKLQSGDPNVIQGVVDPGAGVNGSWNIEVLELAQKAAAITNGFPDKDHTEIGVGYFKFETPEGDREVYIGGENNTLEGAANAINRANMGMRATVINDRRSPDAPFKLMVTGEGVGNENQVSYPTLYFLDGDQDIYFDENRSAKNGVIKVDGFEFEVASNSVKDIIPGVTLELKQAQPGRSVNITVKEDQEVVSGKVKDFVDAINGVLGFIQQQNKLDQNTDTSRTLGGDSILRSIENRFRRLIQGTQMGIAGPIKRLSQLGIEFNRNGLLEFKQERFDSELVKNPPAVQQFLAGDGFSVGFIPSLKRTVQTIMDQSFGAIPVRRKALENRIRRIDDRIANKERALVRKEKTLKRKFANLEQTVSRLKSQAGAIGGAPKTPGPTFGG